MGSMSLVTQSFLLILISVCYANNYGRYKTTTPAPDECGRNMLCVPEHICINNTIEEEGAEGLIDPRASDICPKGEVCCHKKVDMPMGCGYRNERGYAGQFRGATNESGFGEFPWMLAIFTSTNVIDYVGGGSLIHQRVALTAAHIVQQQEVNKLIVRAGDWNLYKKNEPLPHQERPVIEMVIHENFKSNNLHFDIALLFLQSPFDLKSHINTVCLPPPYYRFDGSTCYATGWGAIKVNDDDIDPEFLKKISLKLVLNPVCQGKLRRTELGFFFRLHDSFLCASGPNNEDACTGDGGSPLVCPIQGKNGQYYQAGLVSWGLNDCNVPNVPGVYSSMPYLRSWVDRKFTERGIDFSTYTPV